MSKRGYYLGGHTVVKFPKPPLTKRQRVLKQRQKEDQARTKRLMYEFETAYTGPILLKKQQASAFGRTKPMTRQKNEEVLKVDSTELIAAYQAFLRKWDK